MKCAESFSGRRSINSVILANTIPRAQLVRWKDGGHAMIYQYPDEIGNKINNFIAASQDSSV